MFSPPLPTHRFDWGAGCPDGVYRHVVIRDDVGYRVHGRLGNAKYFTFDVMGVDLSDECAVVIDSNNLEADEHGDFEFFLGGAPREQAWYSIPPGARVIATREFFDDWLGARRAILRIDCLDPESGVAPRSAAHVAAEFDAFGDWVYEGAVRFWLRDWHSAEFVGRTRNAFMPQFFRVDTDRPVVCRGSWQLGPNEALLIELGDFDAAYWGLQLASPLIHTLDFANRLTTINSSQAHRDDDGRFLLVLAHDDPGVYNWLDTTGLEHGELILRLLGAPDPVPPATRLVKRADLATLSDVTRMCSMAERRAQIAERREGVMRMLCD
jgi:hypothetical protein